jgi:glutamine synthetase type III
MNAIAYIFDDISAEKSDAFVFNPKGTPKAIHSCGKSCVSTASCANSMPSSRTSRTGRIKRMDEKGMLPFCLKHM